MEVLRRSCGGLAEVLRRSCGAPQDLSLAELRKTLAGVLPPTTSVYIFYSYPILVIHTPKTNLIKLIDLSLRLPTNVF